MSVVAYEESGSARNVRSRAVRPGADPREHADFEALPAAVYTTDAEGRITYYNSACIAFSGRTPVIGSDHWCVTWKLYHPDGKPMAHDACPMAVALKEGRAIHGAEAIAERPDGTRLWFQAYPTPFLDAHGRVTGAINMLVDITERKLADEVSSRMAAIVESSDDAIISKNLDGIIQTWNPGAERMFGYAAAEVIGKPVTILMPPERVDEEPGILARIRSGERIDHYETVRRRKDGTLLNISLSVSPIRDGSGRIVAASKIARDITERRRAENRLRLLLDELNHRVKNTLATVQAFAMQTLRNAPSLEAARSAFEDRLIVLSKAHDVLVQEHWEGAALRAVVATALAPYAGGEETSRLNVDGPDVRLRPKAALAISMALHELATNALKYGALSNEEGRVEVGWRVERGDPQAGFRLRWSESGGPPVVAPQRRGFGSRLIEQGLAHDLGGKVALRFGPGGVVCAITAPLAEVAANAP